MTGRELLQALIDNSGAKPNAVAKRLRQGQPTLQRFLRGRTDEPKVSSLEPYAELFSVPVNAFFDKKLATQIAKERGLLADIEGAMVTVNRAAAKAIQLPPRRRALNAESFEIPRLDVVGSMGDGMASQDYEEVVEMMRINRGSFERMLGNVGYTSVSAFRIISAYGDSMFPTFKSGDLLLIDTGISEIRIEGIYVLEWRDQLYIKRLQRDPITKTLLMISDNAKYRMREIPENEPVNVRGRVVLAWNAQTF